MASKIIKSSARQVTPVFSLTKEEAKKKVLRLYKAWYRQAPSMVLHYGLPLKVADIRYKVREEFSSYADVKDIRVIDMLVIKGQMELVETANIWKTRGHVMGMLTKDTKKRPKDFLSKFYDGHE